MKAVERAELGSPRALRDAKAGLGCFPRISSGAIITSSRWEEGRLVLVVGNGGVTNGRRVVPAIALRLGANPLFREG
jgi:hypothetical protein